MTLREFIIGASICIACGSGAGVVVFVKEQVFSTRMTSWEGTKAFPTSATETTGKEY